MKTLKNWLGEYMEFEGNLGQAIANHSITNLPGGYIYDDGFLNLAADPEIPIKGLVILGINKPITSVVELTDEERIKISILSNKLIECLHDIGLKKIIQFQDEGSAGQFHIWFLPRHGWTYNYGYNLNDMIDFSKNSLNISQEYKNELLDCIEALKNKFKNYKMS